MAKREPRGPGGGAGARKSSRAKSAPRTALPDAGYEVRFEELDRDGLSVFLYLALTPEETARLVKELGLSQPGFRQEGLGEVQRCDLVADELRAAPASRARVMALLRAGWERPALARLPLGAEAALDLLDACAGEGALPLALWRVLCDPSPAVRDQARPTLARLVSAYYGPAGPGGAEEPAPADPQDAARRQAALLERRLEEAQGRLARAEERAESLRRKGEEGREKLQAWLKEARAREAHAVEEAARARERAERLQLELARLEGELAAARAVDEAVEAQRLRAALRESEARANALEGRLERAQERERTLEAELSRARSVAPAPSAPVPNEEPGEPEEAPASWLMPVYTREFYDSLEGWDRRVQRAAFKQAALLAQDHRHPSLRALPLEGLPGYYRVRVATDVRLLYRRTERQNTIEVLSLIDREDLDRYIKQAKTRG